MLIELVGGYDSTGFWILIFSLLFVGSLLNAVGNLIVKVIGLGLFLLGGVELVGLLNYTIEITPNLPNYVNILPLLFAVILLLVAFKMMMQPAKIKKGKTNNKTD